MREDINCADCHRAQKKGRRYCRRHSRLHARNVRSLRDRKAEKRFLDRAGSAEVKRSWDEYFRGYDAETRRCTPEGAEAFRQFIELTNQPHDKVTDRWDRLEHVTKKERVVVAQKVRWLRVALRTGKLDGMCESQIANKFSLPRPYVMELLGWLEWAWELGQEGSEQALAAHA